MENRLGNVLADIAGLRGVEHLRPLSLGFPFAFNSLSIEGTREICARQPQFSTNRESPNKNNNSKTFSCLKASRA